MADRTGARSASAFRSIGEVAGETGIPQHVLRYWEQHFPQLRPVKRAGGRRYYRPADVALVVRIGSLLNDQGYTIRGVQRLLRGEGGGEGVAESGEIGAGATAENAGSTAASPGPQAALRAIRDRLADALAADRRES